MDANKFDKGVQRTSLQMLEVMQYSFILRFCFEKYLKKCRKYEGSTNSKIF